MPTTAHDQLLDAAARLFYADGITATGVDRVVREAGVTKPTLYAHFGSKGELVVAVLRRRHAERRAELEEALVTMAPAGRALGVFDWLEGFYAARGERGCGFLNAAVELTGDAAALEAVRDEKAWLLALLVEGCAAAGCREPGSAGSQLLLLVDGVAGRAVVGGRDAARRAAADARRAAAVLVGSACA